MISNISQFDPALGKDTVKSARTKGQSAPIGTIATSSVINSDTATATKNSGGASAATVLQLAAQGAPVDIQLVSEIRTAISEGRYPLDPNKIAAAMIAVDMPQRN